MGVDLSRTERLMPQKLLDGPKIRAVVQKVGGEGFDFGGADAVKEGDCSLKWLSKDPIWKQSNAIDSIINSYEESTDIDNSQILAYFYDKVLPKEFQIDN